MSPRSFRLGDILALLLRRELRRAPAADPDVEEMRAMVAAIEAWCAGGGPAVDAVVGDGMRTSER